jgi:DNA-binding PadR family transcriptional regulator
LRTFSGSPAYYKLDNFYDIKEIGENRLTKYLTRKEELILLTVFRLGSAASLVHVREQLRQSTCHGWSVGNVYVPLDRLSRLGFLQARIGEPTARRGGKAVKYYLLTRQGKNALAELKRVHDVLWEGLPNLAAKEK